jgi:homospermidine synthase
MQIARFKEFDNSKFQKYAEFNGKILIIGYGSVGQAILPVILRHLVVDSKNVTVLERDNHRSLFVKRHGGSGVAYVRQEITSTNYKKELSKYVGEGDMIINCSLNIDAKSLLIWCMENGVMEIDTSLERWEHHPDETIPKLADRTLYHTHQVIREAMEEYTNGPTCCVTHGANPGYVTHLTKRALLTLAKKKGRKVPTPKTRDEWAQLMKSLGVKVVHVAERDQQVIDEPKTKNEFTNTWSCEGFWAEGRAPAEMGWGTHEERKPEGGSAQGWTAFLHQPGAATLMKSWVPDGGQYNGYCIQHSESVTISEYFTTRDKSFRPSVYYVYQPSDAAIASLHEMRGNELDLQRDQRILKDEIVSGMDELGVLLIGDNFCFWHGSQLDIHGARKLVEGENATSMQVAGSMLGAIVWMIENPRNGYTEPEELPFEDILEIGDMYWEPIVSVMSNWTPNKDTNSLFYKEYDASNPCSYENFRVWT